MASVGVHGNGSNLILAAVLAFAMFLAAANAVPLCNIDTKEMDVCRPAITPVYGRPLPMPTDGCCGLVRRADLKCLCNLKSLLPAVGINNPANAMALPPKCGLETPPECRAH